MDVAIAYPPVKGKGSPMLTQNRQFQWYHVPAYIFPVIPASAATLLQTNGFGIHWLDCITKNIDENQFWEYVEKCQPGLIAIETKTPIVRQHWDMVKELKRRLPETRVALMGDHVTAMPEESMTMCPTDFVLTGGHYDLLLLGIARHLRDGADLPNGIYFRDNGNVVSTGPFEPKVELNSLPFIDRKLTEAHLYFEKWKKRDPFFYTMAGRDCHWAKCIFCSWTTTHPRFSVRDPENVLDEIGHLIDTYGVKEIFDDTGDFPTGAWLRKFCEGMIDRDYHKEILFSCNMRFTDIKPRTVDLMKKAGFRKIKSGLESANQKTLDIIKKGIQVDDIVQGCKLASDAGIDVQLTIMVGYPWETREEAMNTLRLARELMIKGWAEMLQSTVVVPYPGTPFHDMAKENDWFRIDPKAYERYDMTEPVLKTPDMEPEEVIKICGEIYKIFWHPRFILNNLLRIRGIDDVKYLMKGAKAVSGHVKDFMRR
jgi:radical SAM superfamily enzyme YgiQ (UPF0313 family)